MAKGWLDNDTFSIPVLVTETQVTFQSVTANRAVVSNASQQLIASSVTDTEIGYLSGVTSALQTQLNGKQASGNYITALTGDASASGSGSVSISFATTGVTAASYGSASQVGTFTVDAKGRLTAAGNTAIAITSSAVSDFNEAAQDAVGAVLTDTGSIDFTYNDTSNTISAAVLPGGVDHAGLANLTTGDPHTQYILAAGDTMTGNLVMDNQKGIEFRETTANGTNKVTIQAPASLASDYTLTLPPDDGTTNQVLTTNGSGTLSWATVSSGTKEVHFLAEDTDTNYGNYRVKTISSASNYRFTFVIPSDFTTLVALEAIISPTSGAAQTNRNIDLVSSYGAIGETTTNHGQSNTTSLYNLSGTTDRWTTLNLATVFTSIAAGDFCGVLITQNSVGGSIRYLGIRLRYT